MIKTFFTLVFAVSSSAVMAQSGLDSSGGGSSSSIVNGDFEASDFDYTTDTPVSTEAGTLVGFETVDYFATATSWTGGNGVYRYSSDGDNNSAATLIAGVGQSVFQDITIADAGDYSIDWDSFMESTGDEFDPTAVGYTVSLVNNATSQSIFSQSYVETLDGSVSSLSAPVNITGANVNSSLRLTIARTGTEKTILFSDNVSIEAVPEPSSSMLSGLAGLLLLRRRR